MTGESFIFKSYYFKQDITLNKSLNTIRLLRRIATLTLTITLLLSCVNQQEASKEGTPDPLNVNTICITAFGQIVTVSSENDFVPSLTILNEVVKSIYFKPQGTP